MKDVAKKLIPQESGVYFFRDKNGRILYIGKAVNLRARVGSYFNKQSKDSRISKMLELAMKVDWQETGSEIEALILESQFIKKYRPPFNVMLRDDKQYFYVEITSEKFPKVFITHQPKAVPSEALAEEGPFTDGVALKTTLRLLRRIFPYCTCKQKHSNYCLNYHIGKCLGFCCLKNGESILQRREYLKNITAIKNVLEGKKTSVLKNFKKEMLVLGKTILEESNFSAKGGSPARGGHGASGGEKAIELRDKIDKLEKVFENARIILDSRFHTLDSKTEPDGTSTIKKLAKLLKLRSPLRRIEGYDISNIQGKFATGAMVVFLDGRSDKSQYRKFRIRFVNKANSALRSFSEGGYAPRGQRGDTAMLREVLTRRFNHSEWQYPDLIVIDGGVGQLNAALSVVPKNIPVLALTKDDRHRGHHVLVNNPIRGPVLGRRQGRLASNGTGKKTAMPLTKMPEPVRNLILQVDAEAHRFAINYYRKLHRKLN